MLFQLDSISKSIGGRVLFQNATLNVNSGDRIGLVGVNGAGKTTLLRIIEGEESADDGQIVIPKSVRIGVLKQEIDPAQNRSVQEEVSSVLSVLDDLEQELRSLEQEIASAGNHSPTLDQALVDRYDHCRTAFEFGGGYERHAQVDRILEGLGFDRDARHRPLSSFSGGWLMRVELAKLLLSSPDVLLLDEPTNHLDLPSIQWFESILQEFQGGIVIISHDRTFLRKHVNRIAEIDRRELTVYEGNFDSFLVQKRERQLQLEARKASQDRKVAEAERFIERFRAKDSKARQVQSRIKALNRLERIEVFAENKKRVRLRIPPATRSGDVVVQLSNIHKRYGDNEVYQGIDFKVRRGQRVALGGPNGAGKSTLLRIAAGALEFEGGERTIGHNVELSFFAQHQLEALNSNNNLLEEIEAVANIDDIPRLRSHLGAFLFSGDDVKKSVGVLSGGEKARLALAKLLLRPANFLILDEPTNHLDLVTCEVLEEALREYSGTLLFISHDRSFIDSIATRFVEVIGGVLTDYPGNYSEYLASRIAPGNQEKSVDSPQTNTSPTKPLGKSERIALREKARERESKRKRTQKKLLSLETSISESEGKLEELGHRMADPEVYKNGEKVRSLEVERRDLREQIDQYYREWERTAAELESLESILTEGEA